MYEYTCACILNIFVGFGVVSVWFRFGFGLFVPKEKAFAASASTVSYKVISTILVKSSMITSIINCRHNTSLRSLTFLGKLYIYMRFQMCKHFVVVFKTQKKHTTLQLKMYSKGCKNAKYE